MTVAYQLPVYHSPHDQPRFKTARTCCPPGCWRCVNVHESQLMCVHRSTQNSTLLSISSAQVGLLFTSRPEGEVTTYFNALAVADHAPPGFVHDETIPLPTGSLGNWPVSMMEQFRKLGVVVEVEEGVLVNRKAINMCTAGEPISPEGAKLLVSSTLREITALFGRSSAEGWRQRSNRRARETLALALARVLFVVSKAFSTEGTNFRA